MEKRLYRSSTNKMVCGVCAGVAEYFGIDPTVVRFAWVILTLISAGAGLIGYIAAAIIIPEQGNV